ncbi:CHAD domain-containing protein [Actinacidiphila yanglinensis]|uniref:CHAD domain-containing protein n=1 Tax=Actinacidiphila yanglinensis TaxID=310779 RepID=A0A1H6DMJ8_9ACTN|nr:CYTH and CHAD domain-containing protein [Actinacidiphila yanglinensis]SEG86449.1 CHAD domain-containing protein [Actinacidiphila yanglinensis]
MGRTSAETERTYETGPRHDLPDLTGLTAGTRALAPLRLNAVYYDTSHLTLAAHRITLRRREGGDDDGWHLKLPTDRPDTRTEIHAPLAAPGTPPEDLRAEVAALVRGRILTPIVRLRTTRRRVLLLDDAGRTLAEVAYDEVRAKPGPSWSEIEVELYAGDEALLDAVEQRLRDAGVTRSDAPSKLARALGSRRPAPVSDHPEPPGPDATAGDAATAYLRAQLTAIVALDPPVRRAEEDAVHRMRVATRRARSALKSFGHVVDRGVTDPLGGELKWLAEILGAERDREVLAARLDRRLADLEPGPGVDALRRRVHTELPVGADPHAGTAHAAVVRALDSARYFALLDAFDLLLAEPPYLPGAADPAAEAVAATVRRNRKRLGGAVRAALALPPGRERDVALHEARKDAKRARYSGEAAQPVLGAPAAAYTARMKAVQQLLGEHQDSVMCRAAVARLRGRAEAAGEDPAPYEAVVRAEREIAAETEARLPEAWAAAEREG